MTPSLLDGERVLWEGVPTPGIRFRKADLMQSLFEILFTVVVIFWLQGILRANSPWPVKLIGVTFIANGLYGLAGRFFYEAYVRSHTRYLITNKRVLIVESAVFRKKKTSIDAPLLPAIQFEEHNDGTGSIYFGALSIWLPRQRWSRKRIPSFDFIDNPKHVYELVQNLRANRVASDK
jgi:hypothetical protein